MILMSLANFSVVSLLSLKSMPKRANCWVVLVFQPDVFLDKGHFLAAYPAPAGGELYHDDFSFQIFLVVSWFPSGNNNSMFGAFSPTFTIYPLSSCWAFASEQVMISNSINVRCFIG